MSTDSTPSHPVGRPIVAHAANVGAVKFLFEWPIALVLFTLSLAPIAIFAICVKIIDRGPAFYRQERVGLNGKPFRIIKLRTMRTNAAEVLDDYLESHPEQREEWLRNFKLRTDPRILPRIGLFLRKYSLDEMPQLWNVLRGDMSLVGPRPFPAYHLASFDADFRSLRQCVRPGITGLWQVEVRSNGDLMLQKELDTRYVLSRSLWTDIGLLFRTIWVVLSARGAR